VESDLVEEKSVPIHVESDQVEWKSAPIY